jgi:hypothetical protein
MPLWLFQSIALAVASERLQWLATSSHNSIDATAMMSW